MKKFVSLVLAMVLCLTAVSAFAAMVSPVAQETFLIDTTKTEFKPDGITTDGKIDNSVGLTNQITEGRKNSTNIDDIDIGKPFVFVNDQNETTDHTEKGKGMTNYAIIPFPQFTVGDGVVDEFGKFIIPLSRPVSEYLMENLDKMNIYLMYETDDAIKTYKIPEWYVVATGKNTYGLLGAVSVNILKDAQQYPMCLDFEIVEQ